MNRFSGFHRPKPLKRLKFNALACTQLKQGVNETHPSKSLFGNYEGRCGEGFWLWPRRRVPRIPAAGCKERANAGHGQKTRRPEGFRGKGHLASPCSRMPSELLRGGRAQRLARRAIRPFPRKQAPCEF